MDLLQSYRVQEAEQALVGVLLLAPEQIPRVKEVIPGPQVFEDYQLAQTYAAILRLHDQGADISPISVATLAGVSLPELAQVTSVASLYQAQESVSYAKQVLELHRRRLATQKLLGAAEAISMGADVAVEGPRMAQELLSPEFQGQVPPTTFRELLGQYRGVLQEIIDGKQPPQGVRFGYQRLDSLYGPLLPGHLFVIAGRTGQGKTALAVNIARQVTLGSGQHVLFISLEMTKEEVFGRVMSAEVGFSGVDIRNGFQLERIKERLGLRFPEDAEDYQLYIYDKAERDVNTVIGAIDGHVARVGTPDLVIVDYLQLMTDPDYKDSRVSALGSVSGRLKRTAVRHGFPVIALAQLNRAGETEGENPQLRHIRESGSIEQDADGCLLIWESPKAEPGSLQTHLAKNRHGSPGYVSLKFNKETQLIEDFT